MHRRIVAILCVAAVTLPLAGCAPGAESPPGGARAVTPAPAALTWADAGPYELTEGTRIIVDGDAGTAPDLLADLLREATGHPVPVVDASTDGTVAAADADDIAITVDPEASAPVPEPAPAAGTGRDEAYALETGADGVELTARSAAGAFLGTQSLRQLLPAAIERPGADAPDGGWTVPAASVADRPRFAYRGAMLDVARHFFPVEGVERYLDALALLKVNVLHLHLTDDQGWRIAIDGWPELTGIGASTSVGGDGGGSYSAEDYRRIVAYAAARHITIVPEIDLPGHTNAALSAYPELNPGGVAPPPYEGFEVGFSSLSAAPEEAEATNRFLADVLTQVAALTPGPWLHVGGDESHATSEEDYLDLVGRITATAAATGKTVMGWHELGASGDLPEGTIGQYWNFVEPEAEPEELAHSIVDQGGRLVLSPADVAYLDMKYVDDPPSPQGRRVGLEWAKGATTLDEAYSWEPTEILPGVDEAAILGIEAPLWTETLRDIDEVEFMAFPRIVAIAEIAWSPRPAGGERDHDGFFDRVALLGQRWDETGTAYHPVGGVPWVG
ncbi:family 20 glycosylhydrolase [Agromyces marinus]|uniref:beta-N-acetylhexosaminidase n=1 Tax=Agromyces marinus TaxID=1389020 RepID=A0ABM8H4I9_9MICO|nr:family 20 glycosylhydrolase [Agromyces marinus]UIP59330.1 Beta-N-acetylhexosaminidase [Agromyces marinus]BDZ55646.1 beta-N-acetylhexosaminidase [Agromyces marinus]